MGTPFLRTGAESVRRGTGRTLVAASGRWLHVFLQRTAFALRRYDSLLPHSHGGTPTGPPPDGRRGPCHQPAGAGTGAHRINGTLQCLLRQRTRPLRRPGPHLPRGDLQYERRGLPLSERTAGLFWIHHLDARTILGRGGIRRRTGMPGRYGCSRVRTLRRKRKMGNPHAQRGPRRGRQLHREYPDRRHQLLGSGRPQPLQTW